jgi:hypothetical protein
MIHFIFGPVPDPVTRQKAGEIQKIILNSFPTQTSEGSEFPDDALRMKDQPLMPAELSIGVGSPENLL